MPFSNTFVISNRALSMLFILIMGLSLNFMDFTFRSIFIGLLFSHFALGFYYSKNNVKMMKDKKYALIIASAVMAVGVYIALFHTYLAPYFLVVHVALSDAYLLRLKSRFTDGEPLALIRTVFYIAGGALCFIEMAPAIESSMLIIGALSFAALLYYTKNIIALLMFEIPLLALVGFTQVTDAILHFQYLGFYHIVTWYGFSFWMLFVREGNTQKTISFFSMIIALSAAFVFLFSVVLDYTITDVSFFRIIGTWSILHIISTIPLSKFNPRVLKNVFYAT